MSKLVITEHVTLDGVMQTPGHPDEDTRDREATLRDNSGNWFR